VTATPEDALPLGTPEPMQLRSREKALLDALHREDPRLANMYLGAILVLNQRENPERAVFAAHSARELMEKLPRYRDVPSHIEPKTQPSLLSEVRSLAQTWASVVKGSTGARNRWSGEVDKSLVRFLVAAEKFFAWLNAERPIRIEGVTRLVRQLDPMSDRMPSEIEAIRVREWNACHDFLTAAAHHGSNANEDDVRAWLEVLERFLLDCLAPRTFEDRAELRAIIREAEGRD